MTHTSDPLSGQEHDQARSITRLTERDVIHLLNTGEVEEQGLLPYSSNHSFLVIVRNGGQDLPAVYKPQRGESPLWDFEWGTLCKREVAAYVISTALGWQLVPPTVLRAGTRGLGSVQFYVDNDTDAHYFTARADARFAVTLRRLALFDYIINNADRKSGHCLVGEDGHMWAIDHGVCFHTEYKLRSVIWEFGGQRIESDLRADLESLLTSLRDSISPTMVELQQLLEQIEVKALLQRVEQLLTAGRYPNPLIHRRNYPWPPI
jgi:uncharacterized repeat protein (TIGR03843 family)